MTEYMSYPDADGKPKSSSELDEIAGHHLETAMSADSITILTADVRMQKGLRLDDGVYSIEQAEKGKWFAVQVLPVNSLDELRDRLDFAARSDRKILIHGMPRPETDLTRTRRLIKTFQPQAHRWILIDIDDLEGMPADPEECAEIARKLLPAEFHEVRCLWNATAKHEVIKSGNARLRLFFWVSRPVLVDECKSWLGECAAEPDKSVWTHSVQPIFLGVKMVGRIKDPVAKRWGFLDGAAEVVVPSTLQPRKRPAPKASTLPKGVASSSSIGRVCGMLDAVPNDVDGPDQETWFRIVMATHSATGGSEDGLQAVLNWSARHHSFMNGVDTVQDAEDRIRDRWESLDEAEPGGITGGTLRWHAEQHGYRDAVNADPVDGSGFGTADPELEDVEPVDPLSPADYQAVATEPPKKPKRKVRCARYDEHIGLTPLDVVETLVEDLMTVGEVVVPAGAPGTGKSADLLHLGRCVAAGRPYHGRETTCGGVIFASSENVAEDERRIVAHRKHYGDAPGLPFLHLPQAMSLFNPSNDDPTEDEKFIIVHAVQMEERTGFPCKLIVLDNLRRLINPGDTSKEPDIVRLMTVLERIRDKTGATVMLIAHTVRDGTRFAGSGAIESCADSVWHFEPEVLPGTSKNGKKVPASPGFIRFEKLRLGDRKQKIELRMDASTSVVQNNKGKPVFTVVSVDVPAVGAGLVADNDDSAPDLGPDPIAKPEPVATTTTKPAKSPDEVLAEKQKLILLDVAREKLAGGKKLSRPDLIKAFNARLRRKKLAETSRREAEKLVEDAEEAGDIRQDGEGRNRGYTLPLAA